jgi:hypothetical protein
MFDLVSSSLRLCKPIRSREELIDVAYFLQVGSTFTKGMSANSCHCWECKLDSSSSPPLKDHGIGKQRLASTRSSRPSKELSRAWC